jgi:hypothetical protein
MAKQESSTVTMRIRVGENELEVTGPSDFVKKQIDHFIELNKTAQLLPQNKPKTSASLSVEKARTEQKTISLPQFFRKTGVRTDVDRTLVAGYYLETYKSSENFTASEVTKTIRDAKINPPRNTNECINANIRKGLMMSAGDREGIRAALLTSDGEDKVQEMLQK